MGFGFPYLNESSSSNNSTQNVDLFQHLQTKHADDQQSQEVICPVCAAMINGEPNLVIADLISHIANDHQYSPVDTSSSAGDGTNPYSRQSSSARDYDFGIGAGIRGGFRCGSLRTPGRRGGLGRESGHSPINSNNNSDSSSLPLISFRLSPSFPNGRINYKPMPQKFQSKGIWAGYETQDEFMTMHLR